MITIKDMLDAMNECVRGGCPSDTKIVRIDPEYTEIYSRGSIIPERRILESVTIQLLHPVINEIKTVKIDPGYSFID